MADTSPVKHPPAELSESRTPVVAHILPFVAWLGLMTVLEHVGPEGAWRYAVRTGVGLTVLVACRPWRWYPRLKLSSLPSAVAVGVLVFVAWVVPEVRWGEGVGAFQEFYLRLGMLPLGKITPQEFASIYAPETCGWPMALTRLGGSAFVVAVIEEFFWRGFLYRWMLGRRFLNVKLDEFDLQSFLMVALIFGLEHHRWLAGIVAGVCYGALVMWKKDLWAACVAHVITNFLLGVYVIATKSYQFW